MLEPYSVIPTQSVSRPHGYLVEVGQPPNCNDLSAYGKKRLEPPFSSMLYNTFLP